MFFHTIKPQFLIHFHWSGFKYLLALSNIYNTPPPTWRHSPPQTQTQTRFTLSPQIQRQLFQDPLQWSNSLPLKTGGRGRKGQRKCSGKDWLSCWALCTGQPEVKHYTLTIAFTRVNTHCSITHSKDFSWTIHAHSYALMNTYVAVIYSGVQKNETTLKICDSNLSLEFNRMFYDF